MSPDYCWVGTLRCYLPEREQVGYRKARTINPNTKALKERQIPVITSRVSLKGSEEPVKKHEPYQWSKLIHTDTPVLLREMMSRGQGEYSNAGTRDQVEGRR